MLKLEQKNLTVFLIDCMIQFPPVLKFINLLHLSGQRIEQAGGETIVLFSNFDIISDHCCVSLRRRRRLEKERSHLSQHPDFEVLTLYSKNRTPLAENL